MPASKTFQIPQALALAQDPEPRHEEHVPGRDAHAAPHAGIGDGLEESNQIDSVAAASLSGTGKRQSRRPQPMLAAAARTLATRFESALHLDAAQIAAA